MVEHSLKILASEEKATTPPAATANDLKGPPVVTRDCKHLCREQPGPRPRFATRTEKRGVPEGRNEHTGNVHPAQGLLASLHSDWPANFTAAVGAIFCPGLQRKNSPRFCY